MPGLGPRPGVVQGARAAAILAAFRFIPSYVGTTDYLTRSEPAALFMPGSLFLIFNIFVNIKILSYKGTL